MLTYRPSTPADASAVWGLLDDFRHIFLKDRDKDRMEKGFEMMLIQSGNLFVIEELGYPVGCVWLNEQDEDLHISLHFLVLPFFLLRFYRQKLDIVIIDNIFEHYHVRKIIASTIEPQEGARKLLRRLGFKQRGFHPEHTKMHGKRVHLFVHELRKKDWKQLKKQEQQRINELR